MEKIRVCNGIYWVEIPEAGLFIQCGCPADSVKHLMKRGLIITKEKGGVSFETGPNAILLSDLAVQNGDIANLAEFPVLQMFYRQGMILPNHPNNTGVKPLLIGSKNQVSAQAEYIYRGNYGLVTEEEITASGVSQEQAHEMMRLKRRFAFDNICKTEDLLDTLVVEKEPVELRNDVFVRRKNFNVYEFEYKGDTVEVDLNLDRKIHYESAFQLGHHIFQREYFSLIHSGEGDGWDVNRACMSSVLIFQGRIYLIDAGPNIHYTLTALGISTNTIEGIFHTHAHDDHFAGLTTLLRSDHMIKYYATPLVRASVQKKLCALMGMEEDQFSQFFDVRDLEFDEWNNIDGLEVKPIFSPHPVETSIMYFRTLWEKGYKTYAHLADTVSLEVLDGMVTDDETRSGVTREFYDRVKKDYHIPADVKKIDIGGGLIHGQAVDFTEDRSERLILCHVPRELTKAEKEIGSNAVFGMQEVMIRATQQYPLQTAFRYLNTYFPDAPHSELNMLLNCPVVLHNVGSILIRRGAVVSTLFLVLNGVVEYIRADEGVSNTLSAGSLLGEISGIMREPTHGTFRANSYVKTLNIPASLYHEFARRNNLYDNILRIHDRRHFLSSTRLFGDLVSYPIQNRIAQNMTPKPLSAGTILSAPAKSGMCMVESGELEILSMDDRVIETLEPGGFYGEDYVLFDREPLFSARAKTETRVYHVPSDCIRDIPIVRWKLMETFERRLLGPHFSM